MKNARPAITAKPSALDKRNFTARLKHYAFNLAAFCIGLVLAAIFNGGAK